MNGIDRHLTEALAEKVINRLRNRGPGHCLRIPHVPWDIADGACRSVDRELREPDCARVVVKTPRSHWQATPAKIVELRNGVEESGGRLALFVPAGEHLAAEDSFGSSTFEVLELTDLYDAVVMKLRAQLQSVAPDLAEVAESVSSIARGDSRFGVGGRGAANYLARIAEHPSEEELGRALVEFGLLPDAGIASEEPGDLSARLARNLEQISKLTELAPPADRIQRLSLPSDDPDAAEARDRVSRALRDGTTDREELARRLDADLDDGYVDFASLLTSQAADAPSELSLLTTGGDFVPGSDPPILRGARAAVRVRWRCSPAPLTISGLSELRLELLRVGDQPGDLLETGVHAVKRATSLPRNTEGTWSIRISTAEIDPGLHRLRLQAVNSDNLVLKEDVGDIFLVEEETEEVESSIVDVPSVAAARVLARSHNADSGPPGLPSFASGAESGGLVDDFVIRFASGHGRFRLRVPRLLATVEKYTLTDPRSLARYRLSLASGEIVETLMPEEGLEIPAAFLNAREEALGLVQAHQYQVEGGTGDALVSTCNLAPLGGAIERYAAAWANALGSGDERVVRALLSLDQIEVSGAVLGAGILVGATHPLRLAWLCRYQTMLGGWADDPESREDEAAELEGLLPALTPGNLPHVLVSSQGELRYQEPLDLYWGLWTPPGGRDANALAAEVRRCLGLPREPVGSVDVAELVGRIRRYLASHPYVDLLKVNFVQPGDGDIVLRALMALQHEPANHDLRYLVRLFASGLTRSELGRRLDQFMAYPEPAKARRDVVDAFLASTDDPLTPKLTYSKHRVEELLEEPDRFPAHLTFFLDWFDLDAVPVPPVVDRRSFFAGGLIVDPVNVFRPSEGELNPQWDEHIALPPEPDDWFVDAFAACAAATSGLLDREATGTVPAVRLELDRVGRSTLDAVHDTSDWVVVVDPVFSDEYLDSPSPAGKRPRYLIDSAEPVSSGLGRRIVVSTRSRAELTGLLDPVLEKYGIEVPEDRAEVLLDSLRVLSPALPLRLLNNRTQALEALSLSLASLFLATQGVLRRALVIPLDAHQDLFRETPRRDGVALDLRRTDLAVVRLDADRRRIAVSLVEVKARGQLPVETSQELLEQISAQLENSKQVLRGRLFGADLRERPHSLAAAISVRRLTRLLDRYLDRAVRHGVMPATDADDARALVRTLDRGYGLLFDKHALLFDLEGTSQPPADAGDVRVTRIGREEILDVLSNAATPLGTQVPRGDTELIRTVMGSEDRAPDESVPAGVPEPPPPPGANQAAEDPDESPGPPSEDDLEPQPVQEGPRPEDVSLIGSEVRSSQYGIIGRVVGSSANVALELSGTNVISVFGVQGAGKSYSVGDIIEAASVVEPALNRLPNALATVVFHYSTDESYAPEFAAMSAPNDDDEAVAALAADYGAAPAAVPVSVLVPPGLVETRAAEYGGLPVEPLVLAPNELNVDDWKLLMGVSGGDQMYVRAIGMLFRDLRGELTLPGLKRAIRASQALSRSQKTLAENRVEFVEGFVADGARIGDLVRPGRLLVVDVRDPWLEQDNALALFMVVLRLAAQAGTSETESFNKLIVFDEAHKYMANSRLTGAIVDAVRLMRHKGTTVVLASQDPPSVPREVIELSSIIIAHRFTSPQWLQHVAKVNGAFARMTPAQMATLKPGEAFVWSIGGSETFRVPQRVRMRPRLSRHGGGTRRAASD